MESKRRVAGELPLGIIENMLSFLSVPDLCRMRAVCKSWNEIIDRPGFHDLCDVNGRNHEYLFMWMEVVREMRVVIDPIFSSTLSFLDVNAKRWYSIPVANPPRVCGCGHEVESRFMAMNHGLVCELTTVKDCEDDLFSLAISDPVAKTRRTLPAPPLAVFAVPVIGVNVIDSLIVIAVDGATGSYKVFLLNNLSSPTIPSLRAQPRVYIHESFTNEWHIPRNVPNGVEGDWASSAVVLHDSLFILKQHAKYKLSLFRYIFREDTWAEVYEMYFPRFFDGIAQLAVSSNRLFLSVWLAGARSSDPEFNPRSSDPCLDSHSDCPHPVQFFENRNFPDTDAYFEMYELTGYRRKPVVRLTRAQLLEIFNVDVGNEIDVQNAVPCVDSHGICNSIVLVHASARVGFELRRYELATGSVDVLPSHPLVEPSDAEEEPIGEYFAMKSMNLSLRNLLAQRPTVTSTGWRLLQ